MHRRDVAKAQASSGSTNVAHAAAHSDSLLGIAHILPVGLGYVLCSSLMMIVNKWALNVFPFPGTLMSLQFVSSAAVVRLLSLSGQLECEPLVWARARGFLLVPLFFGIAIFTNIKLLQAASVETAIVFRTIVPIFTSAADWIWMGRALPEARSAFGLAVVVGGSIAYAASSSDGIVVNTWLWAWSYVFVLAFEMVYVKHVLGSVPMSTWTRVYYNNALALGFMPPYMLIGREYARLGEALETLQSVPYAALAVSASCAIGLGISFTGFGFRNLVTATTFTVVGVMNKLLTILASLLLFAESGAASPRALVSLLACIAGGTLYRQAPLVAPPPTPEEGEEVEEKESLLQQEERPKPAASGAS